MTSFCNDITSLSLSLTQSHTIRKLQYISGNESRMGEWRPADDYDKRQIHIENICAARQKIPLFRMLSNRWDANRKPQNKQNETQKHWTANNVKSQKWCEENKIKIAPFRDNGQNKTVRIVEYRVILASRDIYRVCLCVCACVCCCFSLWWWWW